MEKLHHISTPTATAAVSLITAVVLSLSQGMLASHYLYFSHPGDETRVAGVYGGAFHRGTTDEERDRQLYSFAYNCANITTKNATTFHSHIHRGIPMTSLSYDPHGAEVLLTSLLPDGRLSVYVGQACSRSDCSGQGQGYLRPIIHQAILHDQLGPFALYDSQIYFLMTSDEQVDREKTRRVISLRHLDKCARQLPVLPASAFDVRQCSSHVARVIDTTFTVYPTVRVASNLVAYRHAKVMQFIFQLQHIEYEKISASQQRQQPTSRGLKVASYWLKMYHVHTGLTPRLAQPVDLGVGYQSKVPIDYLVYSRLDHLGAVSLKDDKLCWSVVESIYCTGWSRDFHTRRGQVDKVLSVGQATPTICDSTPGDDILANVITGVAIVQTQPRIHLIFGCLSQATLAAGSGELWHTSGDLAQGSRIQPLLDGDGVKVKAGSMLVTSSCHKMAASHPHAPQPHGHASMSSAITCASQPITLLVLYHVLFLLLSYAIRRY